jgi:spore maturation protein CgeB
VTLSRDLQLIDDAAPTSDKTRRYRILCIGETWRGSDAQAAFSAFSRLGHEVEIIDEWHFVPIRWHSAFLRGLRKVLSPLLVRQLSLRAMQSVKEFQPHLLFVFKGRWVHESVVIAARKAGVRTANFYPDVSFTIHGPYLPRTLRRYDHVFNTKTYGIADMKSALGIANVSLVPPGYDPDLHRPLSLREDERTMFSCDVAFIGTWSPKKEKLLSALKTILPELDLRIWGCQWERRSARNLDASVTGRGATGDDYVKAICGAKICLGLLSEIRPGASSGDLITARTFQIPACGTLMLHERNAEVAIYFEEDIEVGFFSGVEELAAKIARYLQNDAERVRVADAGLRRSRRNGYSIEERLGAVLEWLEHSRSPTG